MKFRLITIALLLAAASAATAQNTRFPAEGTIDFEKSVNMYALIKKTINKDNESYMQAAFDQYKKTQPQFKVSGSTLTFSKQKTLFKPGEETTGNSFMGDDPMSGQPNIVFTDLLASSSVAQKKVFDETFLVKDSTRKINWKITTETREIAGYSCRRANAIIMDSVYVVAFYTDQIPVSGGPESFGGLPGMILGVALPHDNVTWFAKTVTDKSVPATALTPPSKGKAVDNKGFLAVLNNTMKKWGAEATTYLKAFGL